MAESKLWYLVSYDIRDQARWRQVYRLIRGFGTRVQLSVFRCRLTARAVEQLRWELEKRMAAEDSLLVVGLCAGCVERIVVRNRPEDWAEEPAGWQIV